MSSRWDAEFDRHQQEQRLLNPRPHRKLGGKQWSLRRTPYTTADTSSPGAVEDYDPEQHLRWPEARKINPDNETDDC